MTRKWLANIIAAALCSAALGASAAAFAQEPASTPRFNPFTLNPVIPGQIPTDWKPVPPSKPVAPPPDVEKNPKYLESQARAACMESVMPIKNLSPVDIEGHSMPFTARTEAAINACLVSKGVTPDPAVDAQDVATDEKGMTQEESYDPSAYAGERGTRMQKMRDLIKKTGLDKFLPAEGSKGVAPPPVKPIAIAAPPVVPLAPPVEKKDDAAVSVVAPYTPPQTPDRPTRGQGVFVPSEGDGPSPIFLH
jgi:hypothetical protein